MPLSRTQLRKAAVDTTVCLSSAPYVRYRRRPDHDWYEVPRAGVKPTVKTTNELFMLGVDLVSN